MNLKSIEEAWQFITEYRLELNEYISSDNQCLLCQNIIVDPTTSLCLCKFCKACITVYAAKNQFCPGTKKECKNFNLVLNDTVTPDFRTINAIVNLQVKFPMKFCVHKDSLINMGGHVKLCKESCLKCPFVDVGCTEWECDKIELANHLQLRNYDHSVLLMETISNLRNENKSLRKELDNAQMGQSQRQREAIVDDKIAAIESKLKLLNNYQTEMDLLRTFVSDNIAFVLENRREMDRQLCEHSSISQAQLDAMGDQISRIDSRCRQVMIYSGEIVWTIKNFARVTRLAVDCDLANGSLTSETFLTHPLGLEMQLELWPNGWRKFRGRGLSVFVDKLKGWYDQRQTRRFVSCQVTVAIFQAGALDGPLCDSQSRELTFERFTANLCEPFHLRVDTLPIINDCLIIKCSVAVVP